MKEITSLAFALDERTDMCCAFTFSLLLFFHFIKEGRKMFLMILNDRLNDDFRSNNFFESSVEKF